MARQEATSLGFDENDARKFMNRLNRDNIAQIVVLESLQRATNRAAGRSTLCVVNTHLYSNHTRPDVKLWQSMNLIREIQQFVSARDLALMICGDFNSEPQSAVYEYILHRSLINDHSELFANEKFHILPDLGSIVHDLELGSAMHSALGTEPTFTNYTAKFKGTLDYIFYTPSRLRVMAVTNVPEESDIRGVAGEGLPAACFPSDHIMLSADIAMIMSGNGGILAEHAGMPSGAITPSNMSGKMTQSVKSQGRK